MGGPHVSGTWCPASTVDWSTRSTSRWDPLVSGPGRPTWQARSAAPATEKHGGGPRASPESRYGGLFRARTVPFERALNAASNGTGGAGWGGRNRPKLRRQAAARSGELGYVATVHGEERAWVRWAPRNPRSSMVSSGARDSSGGHGGELIGGDGFGQVKCGGYDTKRREKKEGIRAGAHRGAQERLGEQREQ